jgi:hypothetical protein
MPLSPPSMLMRLRLRPVAAARHRCCRGSPAAAAAAAAAAWMLVRHQLPHLRLHLHPADVCMLLRSGLGRCQRQSGVLMLDEAHSEMRNQSSYGTAVFYHGGGWREVSQTTNGLYGTDVVPRYSHSAGSACLQHLGSRQRSMHEVVWQT